MPLALSFTTFVQIAFLVDVWRRREVGRFEQYSMFVAFFPHLIAGPDRALDRARAADRGALRATGSTGTTSRSASPSSCSVSPRKC